MALKKREKTLALLTASLVLAWLLVSLVSGVSNPFGALNAQRTNLAEDVAKKRKAVQAGKEAEAKLKRWRSRSLPSDPLAAKSRYGNWLYETATDAGMRGTRVEPVGNRQVENVYRSLSFSVQGRVALDDLTEFLYHFYSAGHLHQIRWLSIKPGEGAREFDVALLVEALSLPDADRAKELADQPTHRLAKSDLASYQETIVRRNLFAPYTPPPREDRVEGPPPPPAFDHAKHTYVTAIVSVNGVPEVWIQVRTTGKSYQLHEGESFEVGDRQGKIVRIGTREVVIDLGDEQLLAFQGESLREAQPLGSGDEDDIALGKGG